MTKLKIVIQVDDKQKMLDTLTSMQSAGEEFAAQCEQVLVNEWGARQEDIDHDEWLYIATGRMVASVIDGIEVTAPSEFVAKRLAMFSDKGLAISGLDRSRYERERAAKDVIAYAKAAYP